jgi:hypothetical protein
MRYICQIFKKHYTKDKPTHLQIGESMKKSKGTQGRNPFTKIEKARSEAVKSAIRLREVESEYNANLGILPDEQETDHGRSVMQVAQERMEMTEELERVNAEINHFTQMQRQGIELSENQESAYQALRDERSEILEVFDITPDLGTTYQDWAEADDEMKKRDIGRPRQNVEVQLLRARRAYAKAETHLHSLEKRKGEPLTDISALASEEMKKSRRPGRPKKDPIALLREKYVNTEAKIIYLESGVADKEFQQKIENAPKNDSGKIIGRPPVNPQNKFESLQSELQETSHQMSFMLGEYDEQLAEKAQLQTLKSRITMIHDFIESHKTECSAKGLKLVKSRLSDLQDHEIELVNTMSSHVLSSVDTSDAETEKDLKEKGEKLNKMLEDARNSRSSQKREQLLDESEALLSEFGMPKAVNQ